ncbi:MAG: lipopolysaccharide assembly protein LapB, partial [Betaproteobacteria bacterium]|nr:lipopolysaccharide assembly protein LapB [Betaproteobacteria bacterium]
MHLSLLEKKELTKNQRDAVKAELALDYLKAGLYDRAEELFKNLTNKRYRQPALHSLLEIYVREREWLLAVETAIELERLSGIPFRKEIAQYHCELAMNAMIDQQPDQVRLHLANALDANKKCIRANVLLGELEMQSGSHAAAISHWKHIEFQDPEYLGLVANKLLQSHAALDKLKEGMALLKTYLENYKLPSIMTALYEATIAEEGANSAATLARNELIRQPSLKTLDQLLQARAMAEHLNKSSNDQDIQLMQQTVRNAIGNRAAYHCNQCGFRAIQYHWQCPACNAWESLPSEPSEAISRTMTIKK